ncbi:serine hydrolase domain-containing protein [Coralloluteibacterium stylophorae]|uniref:Beta-lactamase family protein n=1 Tax=Coralloluteibacterium stylophorae TaxID=1776034 RepID=A0A8J8AX82_9GAMM|nr:serine hydrolase domain-containing protein [Coralloluteibacterium stylophorae]MBS7457161.1 beta-lactamase family protein [Coralloluteibacterium stylophorae]
MKLPAIVTAFLLATWTALASGAPVVSAPPAIEAADLDARIERLMRTEDVEGLAIAVIDGRDITHVRAFGHRNVARRQPLETDTIMYGASLTKAAFAYMVLQLVDEGRIGLDRPISDYLDKPLPAYDEGDRSWATLEGQEAWRLLTPRILLTHSSGLANLRFLEPEQALRFHFSPGRGYAYSGEGYYLLQFVLEEGLGLDVKAEMQRRIFDRFGMPDSDMQWRADFAGRLADGYAMDGSFEPHDERSTVSASGSMDTTIADQARMWRGMLAGEGLSRAMRAEWIRPAVPIRTAYKFPTIQASTTRDPRTAAIGLGAGLGVEAWQGPRGPAFAKGGHNEWTGNIAICQQVEDRCVVLLSNSVRAEIIYPEIVELVLGETNYPWWWTYPELHRAR